MAGVNWGFKAFKAGFFDREAVLKKLATAERRILSQMGAFIRRRAKSSIRKRKRYSDPGQPPSSHTGVLKQFIFFAYDTARNSVVIGPTLTNQRNAFAISSGGADKTIPGVLEFGGTVGLHEVFLRRDSGGIWVRINFRARMGSFRSAFSPTGKPRPTRVREARYAARPYMRPAGNAELPAFRELLRNMVN